LFFGRKKKNEFDQLIARARLLYEDGNVVGLHDLQRILLKPVQANHIRQAYLEPDNTAAGSISLPRDFGFNSHLLADDCRFSGDHGLPSCFVKDVTRYPVLALSRDIALPTSWHPTSIVRNLGRIGAGLPNGSFTQSTNHQVVYFYPLSLVCVENGNHSIAQGIMRGEGSIVPEDVYDVSGLLDAVSFDGRSWRSEESERIIGTPRYREFGWVWEIAKFISRLEESPYAR